MLARILPIKYIINIVENFVGYLHNFASDKYTELSRNTKKMQFCNRIYYSKVY